MTGEHTGLPVRPSFLAYGRIPTLEGYHYAIKLGADFIEPDVVPAKDGMLITRCEPDLGSTTDSKDHPEFTDRYTTKIIDGVLVSG